MVPRIMPPREVPVPVLEPVTSPPYMAPAEVIKLQVVSGGECPGLSRFAHSNHKEVGGSVGKELR